MKDLSKLESEYQKSQSEFDYYTDKIKEIKKKNELNIAKGKPISDKQKQKVLRNEHKLKQSCEFSKYYSKTIIQLTNNLNLKKLETAIQCMKLVIYPEMIRTILMAKKFKHFFDIQEVFNKKENSEFNEIFFNDVLINYNTNLNEPRDETLVRWTNDKYYDLPPQKISKIFSKKNSFHEKSLKSTKLFIDEKMRILNLHQPIVKREFEPVEEFFRSTLLNNLKSHHAPIQQNSVIKMIKQDIKVEDYHNSQEFTQPNNFYPSNSFDKNQIEFNPEQIGTT